MVVIYNRTTDDMVKLSISESNERWRFHVESLFLPSVSVVDVVVS